MIQFLFQKRPMKQRKIGFLKRGLQIKRLINQSIITITTERNTQVGKA